MKRNALREEGVCLIYIITNTLNNKVYIGQTWTSLKRRFYLHKRSKACPKLHRAFNAYGRDNFSIDYLGECNTQILADKLETFFIKEFDSIENGYNSTTGGSYGKHCLETKKKMSKIGKEIKLSSKSIEKLRDSNTNKDLANLHKLKIGLANAKFDLETIQKIKKEYEETKCTILHLVNKYSTSKNLIRKILRGEYCIQVANRLGLSFEEIYSKTDLDIANKIREDYITGNYFYSDLCKKYNISESKIWRIINNISFNEEYKTSESVKNIIATKLKGVNSKFTNEEVLQIRKDYEDKYTISSLAKKYNTNRNTISSVLKDTYVPKKV